LSVGLTTLPSGFGSLSILSLIGGSHLKTLAKA
jgi:hypothetical protein